MPLSGQQEAVKGAVSLESICKVGTGIGGLLKGELTKNLLHKGWDGHSGTVKGVVSQESIGKGTW